MADSSVARSGQESTNERAERGRQLFREHSVQFRHEGGAWLVPSTGDSGIGYYAVQLGQVETCECRDYEHRGTRCKHIVSASIAHAKGNICSCCGHRVLNRFLSEVTEDDDLLGWFVADMICADCVRAGYWA